MPEAVIPGETAKADTEEGEASEAAAAANAPPALPGQPFPFAWILDTRHSPFPTSVLARFAPKLAGWGGNSWLTGRIVSFTETGAAPRRHTSLGGVEIHDADLARLLNQVVSTRIEGNLGRLAIREGELSDNVFLGSGRIHLLGSRFKKEFLTRFQKEFGLEFQPGDILINRFPEDMVPLDRVMFDFELGYDGVSIKAAETSRGVIAVSESTSPPYRILLTPAEKKTVPYPTLLETLSGGSENSFWSRFYRDALSHLPVPEEETD